MDNALIDLDDLPLETACADERPPTLADLAKNIQMTIETARHVKIEVHRTLHFIEYGSEPSEKVGEELNEQKVDRDFISILIAGVKEIGRNLEMIGEKNSRIQRRINS